MNEKDLQAIQDWLAKNPNATSADVMKAFPAVKDEKTADAVFGYAHGLEQGNSPKKLQGLFPELFAQPTAQPSGLANAPEIHGTMPGNVAESTAHAIPVAPHTGTGTIEDDHAQTVKTAKANNQQYLDQNHDKLIAHIHAQTLNENTRNLQQKFNDGQITQDQYDQGMSQTFGAMLYHKKGEASLSESLNNPQGQNLLLNTAKKIDPANAPQIAADQYYSAGADRDAENGVDGAPINAAQRLKNYRDLKAGKITMNNNGQLIKPLGPVDSFVHAVKQNHSDLEEADWIRNASTGQILQKYTDEMQRDNNPDNPVEAPANTLGSGIGNVLGQMAPVSGRQAIVSLLASRIPGAGEALAPVLSSLGAAGDISKQTFTNSFKQHLKQSLANGENPVQAVDKAKDIAETQANADFVSMSAMGALPESKFMPEVKMTPGVVGLMKYGAEKLGSNIAEKTPGAYVSGGLLGASQAFKEAQEDKPEDNGEVTKQLLFGGGLHYMTALLSSKVNGEVPQKVKNSIVQNLGKLPPEIVDKTLTDLKNTGSFTDADVTKVKTDIASRSTLDAAVDPRVTNDDDRVKIANRVEKLNDLRSKAKTLDPSYSDDAAKAEIERREQEIRDLTKESIANSKSKQNAVPVESPAKVPVSQASGDGSSLGRGNEGEGPVNKEAAGAQKSAGEEVTTKKQDNATTTSQSSTKLPDRNGEPSNAGGKEKEGPQAAEAANAHATATGEPSVGRILNFRTPKEVDRIMRQDVPKEVRNQTVDVSSVDPKTGEETTEQAPARRAHIDLKRQYKILDKILGCL